MASWPQAEAFRTTCRQFFLQFSRSKGNPNNTTLSRCSGAFDFNRIDNNSNEIRLATSNSFHVSCANTTYVLSEKNWNLLKTAANAVQNYYVLKVSFLWLIVKVLRSVKRVFQKSITLFGLLCGLEKMHFFSDSIFKRMEKSTFNFYYPQRSGKEFGNLENIFQSRHPLAVLQNID